MKVYNITQDKGTKQGATHDSILLMIMTFFLVIVF